MSDAAMPGASTSAPAHQVRPRLWPGVVLVILTWLVFKLPMWIWDQSITAFMVASFAPMVGGVVIALWWLFFSRVPWLDRFLVLGVFLAAGTAAFFLCDPSYQIGITFQLLPIALAVWVGWLVVSYFLRWPLRRAVLLLLFPLTWSYAMLVRLDGVTGGFEPEVNWRWTPTAEDRFLAERGAGRPAAPPVGSGKDLTLQTGDWPGFRGPNRDGRLTGVRLATDWNAHPPKLLWKQRIGPGWSSFTVVGNRIYTQEQRDQNEVVVCYEAATGKEIWVHEDAARFTEPISGAGPRATPTFHEGKLYTLGAKGTLNCLDAATGKPVWTKDIAADAGVKVPEWGFAASPLVYKDVVTVFAGGPDGKAVLGYQAATGDLAWSAGTGDHSYCSLQVSNIAGVDQLLVASNAGLASYHPTEGKMLWEHRLDTKGIARIIQPAVIPDANGGNAANVILGTGLGNGTRLVNVCQEGDGWKDKDVWDTRAISPYYNDLVIHNGHLYGFDGQFFTCVSLADGKGKWRARGYGSGQVLLLVDQALLLILSEKGEVALVEATPEGHKQVAKFKAIEGKTWNHPVLANGRLYVRNGEEAACFELKLAEEGK